MRSYRMLQIEAPQKKSNAVAALAAYGLAPGRYGATRCRAENVSDTTTDEWAERLRRVARDQDEQAFAEIFGQFAPRVKAFLMKSGSNAAAAEECAQDVMATVWHKAGQFDPTRASAATWIFTIARNRRIDMLRRARRPEPEDLPWGPEAEPDQADALALAQDTKRLGAALAQLPQTQRDLIERAYFGDLSHSEIAKITGLPLGTIKSRIRLALERLRQSMT
jgi:RNA polymerase sigma factor (sigma-70 family)